MTDREALIEARKLVERGWCQGCAARDAAGNEVPRYAGVEACVCAERSIELACGGGGNQFFDVLRKVQRIAGKPVHKWNDTPGRTKEEVLAVFDKAIEAEAAP